MSPGAVRPDGDGEGAMAPADLGARDLDVPEMLARRMEQLLADTALPVHGGELAARRRAE